MALVAAAVAAAGAVIPRLVDAEAIRARLVAQVQAAVGRPIAVRGGAELTLLPSPLLSVGRVTIGSGSAEGAGVLVEMDRLDLDVAPLSLLTGAIEVDGARIVRPSARIREGGRDIGDLLAALRQGGQPLRAATVLDGRLTVERRGLEPEVLDRIELDLARAGDGGLRVQGHGRWREQPWSVGLDVADPSVAGPLPVDLRVGLGPDGGQSVVSLRGQIEPVAGGALSRAGISGELHVEAAELSHLARTAAAILGRPAAGDDATLGAAALSGKLARTGDLWKLDITSATLAGAEITGQVQLDQAEPRIEAELSGTRMSPGADLLAGTGRLWTGLPLPPGLTGSLRLQLAGLEWHGEALRELRLSAELPGDDSVRIERLSARLPDEGEIDAEGTITGLAGERSWQAQVTLAAQDARLLLGWLGLPEPALAPDRLRNLSGTTQLGWSGRQLSLRGLDLRLDTTRITGSAALALEDRPQLAAALSVDRLALDGYLGTAGARDILDSVAAATRKADLALDVDLGVLSWQAARAERVKLRAQAEDGHLTLHELSVGELAEASAQLVGEADLDSGRIDLALEADIARPSRLARLAGYEPPAVIGRLGALRLSGTARRETGDVEIEAGASTTGMTIDIEGRLPADLQAAPRLDRLTAKAPDFAAVVRQIGLPVDQALQGPASVEMSVTPRDRGVVDLAASLGLAGSRGELRLRYDRQGERPKLSGSVGTERLEPGLVQLIWDTGEVTLGFPPGPPSRWPGAWPLDPLSWGWLYAADLDLTLGGLATGRLSLNSGVLQLDLEQAPLAGGRLSGRAGIDAREIIPKLSVGMTLAGADAAEAAALAGLHDGLRGRLDLTANLAGAGVQPAAIVGSLAGGIHLRLADGALEGVRPAPADVLRPAPPELPVALLEGDLAVERGIVAGEGLDLQLPEEDASLDLRLDLPTWIVDATIRRPAAGLELRVIGPPGRTRTLSPAAAP